MPISTYDIITMQQVRSHLLRSDASDSLAREVFSDTGDSSGEGFRAISDSTSEVETYLQRDLIARRHTRWLHDDDRSWKRDTRNPNKEYTYRLRLNEIENWPVLWVEQDTKIYGTRYVYAKEPLESITYIAGYRRNDQNIADFPSEVANEVNTIPELPDNIVSVALKIAHFNAVQQIKGLIGVASETQMKGTYETEVQNTQFLTNYVERQLQRIASKRYMT